MFNKKSKNYSNISIREEYTDSKQHYLTPRFHQKVG